MVKQDYKNTDTSHNAVTDFIIGFCFGIILMFILGIEWLGL